MKQYILSCLTLFLFVFSMGSVVASTKEHTPPPGVVIHNSPAASHSYVGSPSITVLKNGSYIASHDYFGKHFGGTEPTTYIYESKDKGQTWTRISSIDKLKWASVFTHKKDLYLLGIHPKKGDEYGDCVIYRSTDNGLTWTTPTDAKSGLLLKGFYHRAPVPIVSNKGKIWHALEEHNTANGWGAFSSLVMSVKDKIDLLNADNWTISNKLSFNNNWLEGASAWLEGNVVIAKDKSIKNILRIHYSKDDKAAMIDVDSNGKEISFNPQNRFVDLPGACKKFTIRYDKKSKKYWTLSNYVLEKDRGGNNERTRNTITLSWSENLRDWHIKDTLLHHPDVKHHGFQYVDWLIEKNDIIAVIRTASEDETGKADNQHNANYLTFHRFTNFREN